MTRSNRISSILALAGVVLCGNLAFADDDMPTAGDKHVRHVSAPALSSCVREKTAVAESFCESHHDQCDAEKHGIRNECAAELRGERHSG